VAGHGSFDGQGVAASASLEVRLVLPVNLRPPLMGSGRSGSGMRRRVSRHQPVAFGSIVAFDQQRFQLTKGKIQTLAEP